MVIYDYFSVNQCKDLHAGFSASLYISSAADLPSCCVWPTRTWWANTGQLLHPHSCLLALHGSNPLLVVGPEPFSSLLPVIGEDKLQSCFRKHVQLLLFLFYLTLFIYFGFAEDGLTVCVIECWWITAYFFWCVLFFYFHLQLLQRNPLHSPVFFFCFMFIFHGQFCLSAAFAASPVLRPMWQVGLVWREFQWRSWKFDVGPRFTFKWEFIRHFLKQNVNQKKCVKKQISLYIATNSFLLSQADSV